MAKTCLLYMYRLLATLISDFLLELSVSIINLGEKDYLNNKEMNRCSGNNIIGSAALPYWAHK